MCHFESSCELLFTKWSHLVAIHGNMETFSALLAIYAGNSPVTGQFPGQRPVTRSFYVFFDLRLNKRWSKHSWGWWFETPSHPLWRHCNGTSSVRWGWTPSQQNLPMVLANNRTMDNKETKAVRVLGGALLALSQLLCMMVDHIWVLGVKQVPHITHTAVLSYWENFPGNHCLQPAN